MRTTLSNRKGFICSSLCVVFILIISLVYMSPLQSGLQTEILSKIAVSKKLSPVPVYRSENSNNTYLDSGQSSVNQKDVTSFQKPSNFSSMVDIWPLHMMNKYNTTNLLKLKSPKFVDVHRNPCWYEWKAGTRLYRTLQSEKVEDLLMRDQIQLKCLPYLYMAGFPKCGTTDLYQKLTLHPGILQGTSKEYHWWTRRRYGNGIKSGSVKVKFDSYISRFNTSAFYLSMRCKPSQHCYTHEIIVDASASTAWDNRHILESQSEDVQSIESSTLTAHHIHHINPSSRIIFICRDPVSRLYSGFLYFRKNKNPDLFHQFVFQALEGFSNCLRNKSEKACLYRKNNMQHKVRLHVGIYFVHIKEWLKVFPAHQILVLNTEEYSQYPAIQLRRIFKFLNLDSDTEFLNQVQNMSRANVRRSKDIKVGHMLPETEKLLQDFYRPYNKRLAKLLNDTSFLWHY